MSDDNLVKLKKGGITVTHTEREAGRLQGLGYHRVEEDELPTQEAAEEVADGEGIRIGASNIKPATAEEINALCEKHGVAPEDLDLPVNATFGEVKKAIKALKTAKEA